MAAGKALLLKLMARLGEVTMKEAYIPKEGQSNIYGYTWFDPPRITINPLPNLVDTVVHELLHSCYPSYSEATVRRLTRRLMHEMTDDEIKAFWDAYRDRVDA
jgi:hypothetical protein